MSAMYPLDVHRRFERKWAERVKSLRHLHDQIAVGTERTSQPIFNNDDSIQVGAIVAQQQLDQSRSRD
jgi:hypothetical protein